MTGGQQDAARVMVAEARRQLDESLSRIGHCVQQIGDEQLWWRPHPTQNSIANLILHLCGNLRQRIVSLIGGAADNRDRPAEFAERGPIPKSELMRRLDEVVGQADRTLAEVGASQLVEQRKYYGASREFDESVAGVILRTLMHLSGHVQEIVFLTRLQLADQYVFQGAPPGDANTARIRNAE